MSGTRASAMASRVILLTPERELLGIADAVVFDEPVDVAAVASVAPVFGDDQIAGGDRGVARQCFPVEPVLCFGHAHQRLLDEVFDVLRAGDPTADDPTDDVRQFEELVGGSARRFGHSQRLPGACRVYADISA